MSSTETASNIPRCRYKHLIKKKLHEFAILNICLRFLWFAAAVNAAAATPVVVVCCCYDGAEQHKIAIKPPQPWTAINGSKVLEIELLDTVVMNVPLIGSGESSIPKYRMLTENGYQLNRQLPDVLLIGVKKSGTRALLEFIRLHPDVRAAGCEVHFFDRHYQRGLHWYRNHMPPTINGQITMEKTPSYFITKDVPYRVHHMNPGTK